jgi:carboxyl-terminal processing protease
MYHEDSELNSVKDMFKKLYLLVVLAAALACNASPTKPTHTKKQDQVTCSQMNSKV